MAQLEVSAKAPKVGKTFNGTVEIPETAAEMINAFGDSAVQSNAWANFKITVQSAIRRLIEAGKTDTEIQSTISQMKMGVSLPRSGAARDPVATVKNAWGKMDEAARKELLAALKAMK